MIRIGVNLPTGAHVGLEPLRSPAKKKPVIGVRLTVDGPTFAWRWVEMDVRTIRTLRDALTSVLQSTEEGDRK